MILYHGSDKKITKPLYGAGNPRNDYGLGFYCTESVELAKEWACQKNTDGFANQYDLDVQNLNILDLSKEPFSLLHWLTILMQNRCFAPKSPIGQQNLQFLKEHFHLNKHSDEMQKFVFTRAYQNGVAACVDSIKQACTKLGHPNLSYIDDKNFDTNIINAISN